ncbi:MAG: hypothetical protein OXU20_00660 [Myxococcales bacterium]|nr:hypothetical protein [Myxococcales bacterium]
MTKRIAMAALAGFLSASGLGCTETRQQVESNTNWLVVCDSDRDCAGDSSCYCGACTKMCEADGECREVAEQAECVLASDLPGRCGADAPADPVCAVPCESEDACEDVAGESSCRSGQCIREMSVAREGNGDLDPEGGPACLSSGLVAEIAVHNVDKVDMLFVVDNAPSMASKTEALQREFPALVRTLTTGIRADGTTFAPAKDLHLAVVSADLGTAGAESYPGCEGFGDDGVMNNIPDPALEGCEPVPDRFLSYAMDDSEGPEDAADEFVCRSALGNEGCGFRQPLEAALKALWPQLDIDPGTGVQWVDPITNTPGNRIEFLGDEAGTGTSGHGDGVNAGFLRHNAAEGVSVLSVVLVTDRDDCSSRTNDHFVSADALPPGSPYEGQGRNLRCLLNEETNLYPVDRYVLGLRALRPQAYQNLVTFSAVVGVPADLIDGVDWTELHADSQARERFYSTVLRDARMQESIDPATQADQDIETDDLLPSCQGDGTPQGRAYPPRRIVEVARQFGPNGSVASICQESFEGVLDPTIEIISKQLGAVCLPHELTWLDDGLVDCVVHWELPAPQSGLPVGTPTSCDDLPFLSEVSDDQPSLAGGGARCRLEQLPVRNGDVAAGSGWFYDDFSEELRGCNPDTPQRIAFSSDAHPPSGVTVLLECGQQVIEGGGGSCDGDDDCLRGEQCVDGLCRPGPGTCDQAGGGNPDRVGEACMPESVPESGFDDREAYLETNNPQCGGNACLVYQLSGDPRPDCVEIVCPPDDPACTPRFCATQEEVRERLYCSCRCDVPEGVDAELCGCPEDFSCVPVLRRGGPGVAGSYCVRTGTISR